MRLLITGVLKAASFVSRPQCGGEVSIRLYSASYWKLSTEASEGQEKNIPKILWIDTDMILWLMNEWVVDTLKEH